MSTLHPVYPRTIGILGGMGPAATVDLFDRIVRVTPARRDQDHIPIVIVNDPAIPDRTQAILHGGADPTPRLRAGVEKLAALGAAFVAIPCNTAHYYLPLLSQAASIPLLDMIAETVAAVRGLQPAVERVGVLATAGTLAVGLYQKALRSAGLSALEPSPAVLAMVMDAIYGVQGVKTAGETAYAQDSFRAAGRALIEQGAQALILGCTEIPLALHDGDLPAPLVASNQALAEAAVRTALNEDARIQPN